MTDKPDWAELLAGPLVEHFWKFVNKNRPIPATRPDLEACWIWTGETNKYGYGLFSTSFRPRIRRMAHTFIYELERGPLARGLKPDHLCRNRGCVRPSHLEPVTNKENILRGVGPTAINAKKTHCFRGHELKEGNIYSPPGRNERWCRICITIRHQRGTAKAKLLGKGEKP